MSRYLYKKIQNISPESLNFQHSGLKLTTLGTDLTEKPLENEATGRKIENFQSSIKKEGEELLENLSINMDTSQKDILEIEDANGIKNIVSVWDVADMKVHALVERLVFYEGSLGYRVLVLKDESRQVVFDSIEFRKKLQESLL